MATTEQKPQEYNFSGLGKINPAELPEDKLQKYQDTLQEGIDALQKRYQEPNWFKVAAGFAKPQLGGFTASLGSAAEALGEQTEQKRAQELPIAQMKAQIEQSNILLGQKKIQNSLFQEWKKTNRPMDEATATRIISLDPSSEVASAVKEARTQENALQQIRASQNQVAVQQVQAQISVLNAQRAAGQISESDYQSQLGSLNSTLSQMPPVYQSGTSGTVQDRSNRTAPSGGGAAPAMDQPEVKPAPAVQPQPPAGGKKPAADATKPLKFKITPSFVVPHPQAATEIEKARNASVIENAKNANAVPKTQYEALQKINDPQNYAIATSANKAILDSIKSDGPTFVKVSNLIRQAGGVANMLEKGVSFNWNGYGVNVGIPVSAGLDAGLSQSEQAFRDTLISNLATSAYYSLLARGIDPSKAGEGKFSQLVAQEMHIDKAPKAIAHQTDLNLEQLKHATKLHDLITNSLPTAINSGSLSPHLDIMRQNPNIKVETGVYEGILDAKTKKYLESLKGKKP